MKKRNLFYTTLLLVVALMTIMLSSVISYMVFLAGLFVLADPYKGRELDIGQEIFLYTVSFVFLAIATYLIIVALVKFTAPTNKWRMAKMVFWGYISIGFILTALHNLIDRFFGDSMGEFAEIIYWFIVPFKSIVIDLWNVSFVKSSDFFTILTVIIPPATILFLYYLLCKKFKPLDKNQS